MAEDNFHFQIPGENIRNIKYDKHGFSPSVQRIDYSEHGNRIKAQVSQFRNKEFSKKDIEYSSQLFVQLETPEKVSIKSQKQKIENLGFELLTFSRHNESIATAKIDKTKFVDFEERLENYISTEEHVGRSYFAPIESISNIPTESKIEESIDFESEEKIEIIINLFSVISPKELLAISNTIEADLRNYVDDIEKRIFRNGITSLNCKIAPIHLTKIASDFSTIKEIKLCQTFTIPQSIIADAIPADLTVQSVQSSSTICIVDSGIFPNNILKNFIREQIIYSSPFSVDCEYNHGTFVASRCIFGDDVDICLATKTLNPYCNVLDVSVFGVNSWDEIIGPSDFLLRSAIEDTVVKYHDQIKVYNLSLGVPIAIQDSTFSDLAKLLDYLAKEYKVLFVVAAGNIKNLLGDYPSLHFNNPNSRIGSPAESLLSLTVGSVVKHTVATCLSESGFISPFSRKGPGADHGVKPEVVAHGGNLISPYVQIPRISTYGIAKNGSNLSTDVGTSFSAPIISQYAQRLFDFYPNGDPNLVKALLCHFTDARNKPDELIDENIHYVGFGEPNIESALRSSKYNSAYIYEGQLDQDNYQFITFHVPTTFTADDSAKLRVKVTITYDPQVNPDNDKEYSESRISAALFKKIDGGMKEITLTDEKYNLPWNPVIQFEKSFSRAYLSGAWELRLRLYTRGKTKDNYLQDFAAVIEIIDDSKTLDVYTDIESEFSQIYSKMQVSTGAA